MSGHSTRNSVVISELLGEEANELCILESQKAVRKVLFESEESIYEKRIQAIIFLSEVFWIQEYSGNNELTSAKFKRVSRGVFSEEVRETINHMDSLYSRVSYQNGHKTRKYNTRNIENVSSPDNREDKAYELISETVELVSQYTDEELMDICLKVNGVKDYETGEIICISDLPK